MKYRSGALLALLAVALLGGCNVGGAGQSDTTPSAGPVTGGTLRWAIEGVSDLASLDPALTNTTQQVMVDGLIFEGLVKLDSHLNIQPAGAASWEVSSDSREFTFHIRPGLKFADGSPCTASDFAYSLNRAFSPKLSGGQAGYYLGNISGSGAVSSGSATSISGVQVVDALTLRINLDKPASYFLYQLTFPVSFVVPKQAVDKYGDSWGEHAYGIGPFMLRQWQHGQSLSLVPNPNYYGGVSKLAAIVMPMYQLAASAFQAYQRGELDIMGTQGFSSADLPAAQNLPGFVQAAQFNNTYVGFNNRQPPFDQIQMRRAFALAVDKQALANQVLKGTVEAADTIIPPGMPGYNFNIQKLSYNPASAQQALTQAGLGAGKPPPTVTMMINEQDSGESLAGVFLQQQWHTNLGLNVELDVEPLDQFNSKLTALTSAPETSTIQMYLSTWGADYPDPQNFLSQQLRTGVGNNNGHYSNADFDRLVDQADASHGMTTRIPLYQQAEQIAINEVGWLPLYYGKAYAIIRPTVQGLTYTAQGLLADDWTQVMVSQ